MAHPHEFRRSVVAAGLALVLLLPGVAAQGTQAAKARLPSARDGTSAVWDGSAAYAFGGSTGSATLKEIVKYEPGPDAATTLSSSLPAGRTEMAAVWTGSLALIFGGKSSATFGGAVKDIYKFDPAANSVATAGAKLPSALSNLAAVWANGSAYLFGGIDAFGEVGRRIYRYDPAADQVTTMNPSFPDGMSMASAIWDGDHAYVFGGIPAGFGGAFKTVYRYSPSKDELVLMKGTLPFPVSGAAAVYDGKRAYLFGGAKDVQNTGSDAIVWYEPASDSSGVDEFTLPRGTAFPGAAWTGEKAFVFGGLDKSDRTDQIVQYVPAPPGSGSVPVGTPGGAGSSAGVPVQVQGKVVGPTGLALVGIPLFLVAQRSGVLVPVAAALTGSDGTYSFSRAAQRPDHLLMWQDGQIWLRPIPADAGTGGAPVQAPPITLAQSGGGGLAPTDLATLHDALEEARVFPVATATAGQTTTVDLGGYQGLLSIDIDAQGTNLRLVVAKLKQKGIDRVPDPGGVVHRWFGLALVDAEGSEVPINRGVLRFAPPPGVDPSAGLRLHHYLVASQQWESADVEPTDGTYAVTLRSLSLFAVGAPRAAPIPQELLFAGLGVVGIGLVAVAAWKIAPKLRTRRRGAPTPPPALVRKPAVELKESEFVISDLRFRAGNKVLLDNLSFGFRQGEILALLGPSGSGKSTLLKCIIGENAFEGEIRVFGYGPQADRAPLKRLVGYVSQETQLYPEMTVLENVKYFGKQYGLEGSELEALAAGLLRTVGLDDRADTAVKVLSGGQQRRASIAATLVQSPALLILDEPTSGLDPITRRNLWKFIRQANRELGVSVIVTTHFLDEAEYADRIVILVRGRVVVTGSPAELVRALPGGGKLVLVELQTTSPTLEKKIRDAAQALAGTGLVKKLDITGYTVRFFVENPQEASRTLFEMFHSIEVPIKSVTTEDARMEDVFVHHAGEPWKEPKE